MRLLEAFRIKGKDKPEMTPANLAAVEIEETRMLERGSETLGSRRTSSSSPRIASWPNCESPKQYTTFFDWDDICGVVTGDDVALRGERSGKNGKGETGSPPSWSVFLEGLWESARPRGEESNAPFILSIVLI